MPRWLKHLFAFRCKHPGCRIVLPCPDHSRRPESKDEVWDRQI